MHVRIVRGEVRPGQAEELARRWTEYVGPRLGDAPGFRRAYMTIDRATNEMVGVSVWDAKPGEAVDQAMRAFGQQAQDLIARPPAFADYEVLAEL